MISVQQMRRGAAVLKKNGIKLTLTKIHNLISNMLKRQVFPWANRDVRRLLREVSKEAWSASAAQSEVKNHILVTSRSGVTDNTKNPGESLGDVYQMWWQGLSSRPPIVARCMESFSRYSQRTVHEISRKNLDSFVDLPGHIYDKRDRGQISLAHFADIVRCEILGTSGGTWVDATVYFGGDGDQLLKQREFFAFRTTPSDLGGNSFRLFATWFLHVQPLSHSRELFQAARECLVGYWRKNEYVRHYFLLDHYISSLIRNDATKFDKSSLDSISKFDVSAHLLLMNWHKKYEASILEGFFSESPAQKLTYDLDHGLPRNYESVDSSIQSFLLTPNWG